MNMIPVASGIMPNAREGGRRIDLGHKLGEGEYEFIELKLGNNCQPPLRAAIEILEYGLIYLFSRQNLCALGYDPANALLQATRIHLKVLAPAVSYIAGSLKIFEHAVNDGLTKMIAEENLSVFMDFYFEMFPAGLTWGENAIGALEAMKMRRLVYDHGSIDG